MHPEHQHSGQEPNPDTSPHQAAPPLHERPQPDRAGREPRLSDELTPAEQEEKDKAEQEARAALASIWETLRQHQGKPAQAEITAAIDNTPLREMKPLYKLQLESVIAAEDPRRQDEQEFIASGMKVLSLWIHLQGLKRGTDRDLADLRAGIGSM